MTAGETLIYADESFAIQGAIFDVYREMGCGFLEAVYQECLEMELESRGIPFVPQRDLPLFYKGRPLKQRYKSDFICYDKIIVELKASKEVSSEHQAQVFNYLKATKFRLGLLVNFGHYPKAQINRIVL
jgi:GxxExxY protein